MIKETSKTEVLEVLQPSQLISAEAIVENGIIDSLSNGWRSGRAIIAKSRAELELGIE